MHLRVLPDQAAAIDAWIEKQDEPVTRPEAIRRLVEIGLGKVRPVPHASDAARQTSADRAGELASNAIDASGDSSATPEERANRKGNLMKGPEEFRTTRRDKKPK